MNNSTLSKAASFTLFFMIPFLLGTAVDLYVPSLPAIVQYFHSTRHLVQLTISLYLLGYGVGQFFLGVLSDSFGRKNVAIPSSIFFCLVSLLTIFSFNVYVLMSCRFLQGFGMAGMAVVCRAIALDCFEGVDLVKVFSIYSFSWAIGPIVGPFIGSYLQHFFNWQATFLYFGLFSLVITIMLVLSVRETLATPQPLHITKLSRLLMQMVTHYGFLIGTITSGLIYSGLIVFNIVGPFLIQTTLHYSVISYGHMALLLGFGCLLGSFANRWLVNYIRPMKLAAYSLCLSLLVAAMSIGCYYLFGINIYLILVPMFVLLFLIGTTLSNVGVKTLSFFAAAGGTANAVFGVIQAATLSIVTMFAVLLSAHSQLPLFMFYLLLTVAASLGFMVIRRL